MQGGVSADSSRALIRPPACARVELYVIELSLIVGDALVAAPPYALGVKKYEVSNADAQQDVEIASASLASLSK